MTGVSPVDTLETQAYFYERLAGTEQGQTDDWRGTT